MSDNYLTPSLTNEGIGMLIRAMDGETIKFTKIVFGDGTPNDKENITELSNQRLEIGITDFQKEEGYLILTGYCSNSDIKESFYAKELGLYAKCNEEDEKLYAYRYADNEVDFFPAETTGRSLEVVYSVIAQIGKAENVSAILIEGDAYASKEAFEKHLKQQNPHGTTADDVGAAPKAHGHSMKDISGTLPVEKGGTGVTSYEELAKKLNVNAGSATSIQLGVYVGNGNQGRVIHLGFKPRAVMLCDNYGNMHDDVNGYIGGIAVGKYGCCSQRGSVADAESWNSNYTTLMIVDDGFIVNYYPANKVLSNENGRTYRYIAIR